MYTYVLAALTFLIGLGVLASTFKKQGSGSERVAGILGGVLIAALGVGIGALALDGTRSAQRETANERARAVAVAEMPVPTAVEAPQPAPDEPAPAPATPSGRTDIQNLAIIAGRSDNDPELVTHYARLQALCPPEAPSIGDMVATMQRLVREQSGREMDPVELMKQLATAQEGGQPAGMKCSETGGMLVTLLAAGM